MLTRREFVRVITLESKFKKLPLKCLKMGPVTTVLMFKILHVFLPFQRIRILWYEFQSSFYFLLKSAPYPSIYHCLSLVLYYGNYRGADKSLARPGREKATATEDLDFHISYL